MTYFEGDSTNGLEPDLEAKQLWLDRGVAEDHILPGNAKDNFWGMRSCAVQKIQLYITTSIHRNGYNWAMRSL